MIKLKIDNIKVQVKENTSVLMAAESIGIEIPTMCFMEGYTNHPSCMVCLVKDKNTGSVFPSCAINVTEGMEIITSDEDVINSRKKALELLLSDHVGDCEAPCRIGCPAFMNIPLMNRLIAQNKFDEALKIVKEEIALPLILGYICSAPCEKVCRRVPIDNSVSICQLKRMVASEDLNSDQIYYPQKAKSSGKKVAIIGAGPAGISCAFYLTKLGHQCVIIDRNREPGGSLRDLNEDFLPKKALYEEIKYILEFGVKVELNKQVKASELKDRLKRDFDAIVISTGSTNDLDVENIGMARLNSGIEVEKDLYTTNIEGIFACGSVVKKQLMAVKTVAQGKDCARMVDQFLNENKLRKPHRMFNSKFGKLKNEEYNEYLADAIPGDRIEPHHGHINGLTNEDAILEAKRCMHCDCRKPESCKLRIYANEYGANRRKYLSENRKTIRKYFNHDTIVYEPEKCIKCGLCVEITRKEKELTGLSFVGRGFDVKIAVPYSITIDKALTKTAIKCANFCPTGAISFK